MPPSTSDCVSTPGTSKRRRPDNTQKTPLDPVGTTISIADASVHPSSTQNADLLVSDDLGCRASHSFHVQLNNVLGGAQLPHLFSSANASLESERHASSSVLAKSIPSNGQQGSP